MVADELKYILQSESYKKIVGYSYVGVTASVFALFSYFTFVNNFGRTPIFGIINISNITMTMFSGFILLLWFMFNHVPTYSRVLCSLSLPVFGMAFYEAWWHVGCWYTWNMGFPVFWTLYALTLFLATIVLHRKYNILRFTIPRLVVILCLLLVYRIAWADLMKAGFYQALLAYEQGLGPNPEGLVVYLNKAVGVLVWLLLASRPKKEQTPFTRWSELEKK